MRRSFLHKHGLSGGDMTKVHKSNTKSLSGSFLFLGILAAFSQSGCGTLITGRAWLQNDEFKPSSDKVVVVNEVKSVPTVDLVNKFALMALFSKVVYRKDLPQNIRNEQGCDYLAKDAPVPEVGMPQKADGSSWKRWKGTPEAIACQNKDGLSFETYVYETKDGKLDEAVIAFRGTENYSLDESLNDWAANMSAAFGIEPREYVLAQQHIPKLIDELVRQWPDIKVYVTGHSLGGGLAQQAGYMSKQVQEVYTFDTSPVTNWSHLSLRKRIQNPDPIIHRVYHWHEGLAYVRNVTSRFTTRRLGRSDYEFFFQKVPPIAAHEMGILACHLSRLVQGNEADHRYPREFALKVISPDYAKNYPEHPVCPPTVVLAE